MKQRDRIAACLLAVLLLLCVLTGCAQPLLRPANTTETAAETTAQETTPVTDPVTEKPDVPPQREPETTAAETTVPETTASETTEAETTESTIEVSGGGLLFGIPEETTGAPPVPETPGGEIPGNGSYYPSVLMYHLILEEPYTELEGLFVRPSEFEDHLRVLTEQGYQFLFAEEFQKTDKKSVILTFDDGYEDNYTEMFPILQRYGAKATVFMIGSKVGTNRYLNADMIREMAESGLVQFDSHTYSHSDLRSLSESAMEWEFSETDRLLYGLTGRHPATICYPAGGYNASVMQAATRYYRFGFTTVNSAFTAGCDPMAICRVRVSRGMRGSGLLYLLG